MTVTRKITVLVAGAVALGLAEGLALVLLLSSSLNQVRDDLTLAVAAYDGLAQVTETVVRTQSDLQAMLRESDLDRLDALNTDLENGLKTLTDLTANPDLVPDQTRSAVADLAPRVGAVLGPLLSGDKAQATEVLVDSALPTFAAILNAVHQARADRKTTIDGSLARNRALVDAAVALTLSVVGVVLALFIVGGVFLARNIVRPLGRVTRLLGEISQGQGDLTQRLSVSGNDELAELARHFNRLMEGLDAMVRAVRDRTGSLQLAGTDLADRAGGATGALDTVGRKLAEVDLDAQTQAAEGNQSLTSLRTVQGNLDHLIADLVAETTTVTDSSRAIEHMLTSLGSVTASFEDLGQRYQSLVGATAEGQETLQALAERIGTIAVSSRTLVETNQAIEEIAGQTNLLAMNAAIEAAHAGEAGKGFSVVADEVRQLAEKSATQARESARQLNDILGSIETVVTGSEAADQAFHRIRADVEAVDALQTQVRRVLDDQAAGSHQILDALAAITQATTEVRTGVEAVGKEGGALVDRNTRLQGLSDDVRHKVQELVEAANEARAAVATASDRARTMATDIEGVSTLMARFKV